MNFAINDNEFKEIGHNFSYEKLNKFILDKVLYGKICDYYIAEIIYDNMEIVEPFYIDLNNMCVCWVNDWYEGGAIYSIFGFIDSETIKDFTIKYLWRNRYRGGFDYESNHN